MLDRVRYELGAPGVGPEELALLTAQLTDALSDVLLIAESRGGRLAHVQEVPPDGRGWGECGPVRAECSQLIEIVHGALNDCGTTPQVMGVLVLPGGDLASAGAARRYVRGVARSWELLPEAVDTLEAITGELVANALEHGHSQSVTVALSLAAGTVTVSLTDEGTGHVFVLGMAGPEQESGRGLLIVDALATRWGQRQTGGRFTVWAEADVRHDPAHEEFTRDFREEP